jgi:SNF2 family DNA or RNA helicase
VTIAAVEELVAEFGEEFRGVVVCGGGLKDQWRNEIAKFTGGAYNEKKKRYEGGSTCIVIDGNPDKRMELYERVLVEKPTYVVLSYNQVVDDYSMVVTLPQEFVVAEEITTIKNPDAAVTQAMRAAFGDAAFKFGLTGTPMENGKAEELFQAMVFVDPSVLGRADIFDKTFVNRNKYGQVKSYKNIETFRALMAECSVSIDADDPDVSPFMPRMTAPKRVLVEADEATAWLYNEVMSPSLQEELTEAASKSRGSFDVSALYAGGGDDDKSATGRIMSRISCMRMLLSHPAQLIESAHKYREEEAKRDADPSAWPTVKKTRYGRTIVEPRPLNGSAYAASLWAEGFLDDLDEHPKMDEILLDVRETLAGDCSCCYSRDDADALNKVVVFSYHKTLLAIMERALGAVSVRYDGSMTLAAKNKAKHRFQTEPGVRVFLTSDAGGYGIDLPQANHLFNADVPFTAGKVTQRNARVRRATREFHDDVFVRNYLIDGSLEVYYAEVTAAKNLLPSALRHGRSAAEGDLEMRLGSLGGFLAQHEV